MPKWMLDADKQDILVDFLRQRVICDLGNPDVFCPLFLLYKRFSEFCAERANEQPYRVKPPPANYFSTCLRYALDWRRQDIGLDAAIVVPEKLTVEGTLPYPDPHSGGVKLQKCRWVLGMDRSRATHRVPTASREKIPASSRSHRSVS